MSVPKKSTNNNVSSNDKKQQLAVSSQLISRQEYNLNAIGTVNVSSIQDHIIVEQPVQIILDYYCHKSACYIEKNFMLTMRTPGHDNYLVTGLLLSQGIINSAADITSIESETNQIEVTLAENIQPDWAQLSQYFVSHSGCGVCGQTNIKSLALRIKKQINTDEKWLPIKQLLTLPDEMRKQQSLFSLTGGVHSAGIFSNNRWLSIHEDVGRHNAVDKVIGAVITQQQDISKSVLVLSGRISFELVQKAISANIPVIVAIGAPSNLAIAAAKQFNITLIGFTQGRRCNVYHGEFRLNTTNT